MSIVNGSLQVAGGDNAWHTTYAAEIPLARQIVLNTQTGQYKIGDGSTALSGLTYYGGSGGGTWGSITGTLSNQTDLQNALNAKLDSATAALTYQPIGSYLTSSDIGVTVQGYSANTTLLGNSTTGSGSIVLATSPTFGTSIITPNVTGVSGTLSFSNAAQSSGAVTSFSFTAPNNTGQTAATNIPKFLFTLGSTQWAAGTITAQDYISITQPTSNFVSASTITTVSTMSLEGAPIRGTNATHTTSIGLLVKAGAVSAATVSYGAYINAQSGGTTNRALGVAGTLYMVNTNSNIEGSANLRFVAGSESFWDIGAATARMRIDGTRTLWTGQNVVLSSAALATNATNGFTYLPTCAGAPTGVPTAYTGTVATVYDTTNNRLYIYNGAWRSVLLS